MTSVSLERIQAIDDFEAEEPKRSPVDEKDQLDSYDSNLRGQVAFRNVMLAYDTKSVLKGVNITVTQGQRIGICGR